MKLLFSAAGADQVVTAKHGKPVLEAQQDLAQLKQNTIQGADEGSSHAQRAATGPDVHVDKAAGIINITGLPSGCR